MKPPFLIFLGEAQNGADAKTAAGLHYWRPELCLAEHALPGASFSLGLPSMTPAEAAASGAGTLIVGTVSGGGLLPDEWKELLLDAVQRGMDLASGMHQFLADDPELAEAARAAGTELFDVRRPAPKLPIGTGEARTGNRILTVGTDCNVGKMYTTLALEREMKSRGYRASFKATGQTGILLAGEGVPLDAVPSDFLSGAIEELSPSDPGAWHLIEGQGSLQHPSYAGVALGLIHGAQPDFLVLCSDPTREIMRQTRSFEPPSLTIALKSALSAARLTNPEVRALGCSLNTSLLSPQEAEGCLARAEEELGLPAVDPVRVGVGRLVDQLPES